MINNVQSEDGVANIALAEATNRLEELLIGHNRYEKLRKCSLRIFKEIWVRNIQGEIFDDVVDKYLK